MRVVIKKALLSICDGEKLIRDDFTQANFILLQAKITAGQNNKRIF